MDAKKKILIVGAAALIVMGLVVAANAVVQGGTDASGKGWMRGGLGKRGVNSTFLQDLNLPANATREQISDAMWEKQLKDLGLTDGSTLAEYRQALKARMQSTQQERLQALKTKLNLPADATNEDVMNTMTKWRSDNKDLLQGGAGRHGFGLGPAMSSGAGVNGFGRGPGACGGKGFGKGG
jgi:hypothetical protein